MADITSDIDTSDIVGNEQIDTGDVTTPFDDLIGVINDILNGARSFDQINLGSGSELTIASGAITCSGSVHSVDTEGDAATDDLDTIHMVNGDFVFLRAASADREVTLKHGASIQTGDGTDVVLDNTMKTMLLLRSNGVNYVVGGAGPSYPEDYISGLAVHATSATAITVKPGKALTSDGYPDDRVHDRYQHHARRHDGRQLVRGTSGKRQQRGQRRAAPGRRYLDSADRLRKRLSGNRLCTGHQRHRGGPFLHNTDRWPAARCIF